MQSVLVCKGYKMSKVRVTTKNYSTASPRMLAASFKHQGMDKYRAWDEFIKVRGLRPEIDAQSFYAIFDDVSPRPWASTEVEFIATHYDTTLGMDCMITEDRGIYHIVWEDGHGGTNPPTMPPTPPRFQRYNREVKNES